MMDTELQKAMLGIAWVIVGNFGTFAAVLAVYTEMIRKQAKIEFLLKQVCDKLDVSTTTHI